MLISDWSSDIWSTDLYLELERNFKVHPEPSPAVRSRFETMVRPERLRQSVPDIGQPDPGGKAWSCFRFAQPRAGVGHGDLHSVSGQPRLDDDFGAFRSEERRVGKECVSTCRSRWSPYH